MTAYLGTSEVRSFIVPATPQPDMAVAANYERFDGLMPLDQSSLIPFGVDYGPTPIPGQNQTPIAEQTYTPGPNVGLVNTLGGQPLPVGQWSGRREGGYTPAPPRTIGGPKMGRQHYNGIAETVFFAELQSNPPQPGDLASIIAGIG